MGPFIGGLISDLHQMEAFESVIHVKEEGAFSGNMLIEEETIEMIRWEFTLQCQVLPSL